MGAQNLKQGSSDQFDDLIMDPQGASEGPEEMDQKNQGYDDTKDPVDIKPEDRKESDIETFDNINPNSQLNAMEKKEDDPEDKDEKKEESAKKPEDKKEEDDKKEVKDSKPEEEKKEPETKIEGKAIKLFKDNKAYEVPQDAQVKVKVDGKWEKVSVSELRDNYSGQKSWDQKFSEISGKEQTLAERESQVSQVQETINNTMEEVATGIKEAMAGHKNPMEAVNKIVDLLNIDSYDFNRALFDSLSEELVTLDTMDEFERKAYWLEKKTNHLETRHKSFEEKQKQSQTQAERLTRVDQMREAHGVSEDDFVSAYKELEQSGKSVNPEQVVQYAAKLPFVTKAETLLTPYEDQLSDDEFDTMMSKVANTMMTNKQLTDQDVTTYLAEYFEVDNIVNAANSKADKLGTDEGTNDKGNAPNQHDLYSKPNYESFTDFEY